MAFVVKNVRTRIQTALSTAITITAISKASEAVITAANSLSAGDWVVIRGVTGMTEINERVVRVKSPSGTQFTAEGLDSTDFTTYVSGGSAYEVTTFATLDNITSLNFSDNPAAKQDITAISDTSIKETNGLKGAPTASFGINADPLGAGVVALRTASRGSDPVVIIFDFLDEGFTLYCNAEVSGGDGLNANVGAVATGNVELTLKHIQEYIATL
ncbi:MAG: hypothetical protein KDI07_15840 [Anaerolineae bacterium]|nr:hypothetical protein [Anaerolineae bacterium]